MEAVSAGSLEHVKPTPARLLLTGATGFVGKHVLELAPGAIPLVAGGEPIDLRDREGLKTAIQQIQLDCVLHLVGRTFVPDSFADSEGCYDVNFLGTLNLLEALADTDFSGRFLFVSSADIYGKVSPEDLPVDERRLACPCSPYAVSKVAAEALCLQWSQTGSFEVFIARPFNHVGPGQAPSFVASRFAKRIIEIKLGLREPVLTTGDLAVTRDFTDVRDVVRAYLALFERASNGEVYQVCSGQEWPIDKVLTHLMASARVHPAVLRDEKLVRPGEQERSCGSYAMLENATGWKPRIPIEQSLNDLLVYRERELTCQSVR